MGVTDSKHKFRGGLKKSIMYFDNAATTQVYPFVLDAMAKMHLSNYGNPSASHLSGRMARTAVENARETIADLLAVKSDEIYFTSGATESINTFLRGFSAHNCDKRRNKIIITNIDHKAVSATCDDLKKLGYQINTVDVLPDTGLVNLQQLYGVIDTKTLLVCIIMANNEIGVIQPVDKIAEMAHRHGALFFSDTTQIAGKYEVHPKELGIDAMCISAHKFGGPKGVGLLYISGELECNPIMTGGPQEHGIRAGTLNTPGIVGLASAMKFNLSDHGQELYAKVEEKRDWIQDKLSQYIPGLIVNALGAERVGNILSVSVAGVNNGKLTQYLDEREIVVNTGSACNAGKRSNVLAAIGLTLVEEQGTIRISLSPLNTWDECDLLAREIITYIKTNQNTT